METYDNTNMDMSGSTLEPTGSRWNPTKEQIDLLENLYRQGVRTPSTEQIQQITSKLRVFGHIEGKNVFYWFQNHKARQRQKQKQDNIAILNRFMLHQPPTSPRFVTYPNVACHPPFFIIPPPPQPPVDFGSRPSYQKLVIPGSYNRTPLLHDTINNNLYTKPFNNCRVQEPNQPMRNKIDEKGLFNMNNKGHFDQETLPLFPLHPTGNLQANRDNFPIPSSSTPISGSSGNNHFKNGSGNLGNDRPFIDFFCMDGQCKTR